MGASGSGKTSALEKIEREVPKQYMVCHFDSLGVPSETEVKEKWGGWDTWQKMRIDEWMQIIVKTLEIQTTIFDCQMRPEDIEEACKKNGIKDYSVILLDCSDEERASRLRKRNQPHLITPELPKWAKFLRDECAKRGYTTIDNTLLSEEEAAKALKDTLYRLSSPT